MSVGAGQRTPPVARSAENVGSEGSQARGDFEGMWLVVGGNSPEVVDHVLWPGCALRSGLRTHSPERAELRGSVRRREGDRIDWVLQDAMSGGQNRAN
jgi:hypothetical protein